MSQTSLQTMHLHQHAYPARPSDGGTAYRETDLFSALLLLQSACMDHNLADVAGLAHLAQSGAHGSQFVHHARQRAQRASGEVGGQAGQGCVHSGRRQEVHSHQ